MRGHGDGPRAIHPEFRTLHMKLEIDLKTVKLRPGKS
jgi:hypothetical protein